MMSKADIVAIARSAAEPAVSILMPTHRAGSESRQDPIRLNNLLSEAEHRLIAQALRRADVDSLLAPGTALIEDGGFWLRRSEGLALYLAPGFFRAVDLPYEPEERLSVGRGFRIRPLLPLIDKGERFHVVAVSMARSRLFAGDRRSLVERSDLNLPAGVKSVAAESDYQQMINAAGSRAGSPAAMLGRHNFGGTPEDLRKVELIEYLHRVDAALQAPLAGVHGPVVIAGDPQVGGHFHRLSRLPNLLADALEVNVDALEPQELHRRVLPLVEPSFGRDLANALDHLHSLRGTGDPRLATAVPDIVKAARYRRIDLLFLPNRGEVWGRFDEATDEVAVRSTPAPGDTELLDQAAADTLANGGSVYALPKDQLPLGAGAAAILRY